MSTGGSLSNDGGRPAGAVAVFCGSRSGTRSRYLELARETGRELARRGLTLVYGGATVGLMGALADACLVAGGRVIGVIPQLLVEMELAHRGLTELHVVESMQERKALMAALADGFVVLPGAYGTLDEAFEMVTWRQLGLHAGPLVFVNAYGFFDGLVALMERAEEEGLLAPEHRRLAAFATDPAGALDLLEAELASR